MGVLNVTPDSFSDGGDYLDRGLAISRGLQMVDEGADIIDIGGESTRPGAEPVSTEEELSRVIPVIGALSAETNAAISIDTTKSEVAVQAVGAGADIINDVSAMTADPTMPGVAAETGAGVVLMHMLGSPGTMQDDPVYENVVNDISSYLERRVDELTYAGLARERLAIDPGIGFGKTVDHNIRLLQGIGNLLKYDMPVIVGLSRKSFLGKILNRPVGERLAGSLGALAYCVMQGVHIVRVHDVRESVDVINILKTLIKTNQPATNNQ